MDSSQERDREREDDQYGSRSWNKAMPRERHFDDKETTRGNKIAAKTMNELIGRIDAAADEASAKTGHDYFVKRKEYHMVQIRTTDAGKEGGGFLQIGCYYRDENKGCTFDCVIGAVPDAVSKKYDRYKVADEDEVVKWVGEVLRAGVIDPEEEE